MDIPPRFWKSLTTEEFSQVFESGELTREQCASLWRMLDRQDAPPDGGRVMLNRADLMKRFPKIKHPLGPHKYGML
jgi:hypothetical protein